MGLAGVALMAFVGIAARLRCLTALKGRPQELPQNTQSVHMFGLKNLSPKDHISDSSFFLTPDVATETASSHVAQRWPFSIALMRLISTADLGASFKKSLATLQ